MKNSNAILGLKTILKLKFKTKSVPEGTPAGRESIMTECYFCKIIFFVAVYESVCNL